MKWIQQVSVQSAQPDQQFAVERTRGLSRFVHRLADGFFRSGQCYLSIASSFGRIDNPASQRPS